MALGRSFKELVIFKAPLGLHKPADMVFDEVSIWVQLQNLPLAFMHSSIIRNIAARIGRVLEVDSGPDGLCVGKYARVRVVLDIIKPIEQGVWILPEHMSEEICILLLYERLPNFCFLCGRLGHVIRDFDDRIEGDSAFTFGNWFRASSFTGDGKVSSSASNSNQSSGLPSANSLGLSEESIDPMLLVPPSLVKEGMDSLRDNSALEEIFIIDSDIQLKRQQPHETKLLTHQCRRWFSGLHFYGSFAVDCDRRKGGLLLLW